MCSLLGQCGIGCSVLLVDLTRIKQLTSAKSAPFTKPHLRHAPGLPSDHSLSALGGTFVSPSVFSSGNSVPHRRRSPSSRRFRRHKTTFSSARISLLAARSLSSNSMLPSGSRNPSGASCKKTGETEIKPLFLEIKSFRDH